jgi:hypothetical protein
MFVPLERGTVMTEEIEELHRRMEAAAASMDYEEATRLRDRINLMRGGASAEAAEAADTSGLVRQRPGRMGLGTSQAKMSAPEGWKKPMKPDLMTTGRSRRRPKD